MTYLITKTFDIQVNRLGQYENIARGTICI